MHVNRRAREDSKIRNIWWSPTRFQFDTAWTDSLFGAHKGTRKAKLDDARRDLELKIVTYGLN